MTRWSSAFITWPPNPLRIRCSRWGSTTTTTSIWLDPRSHIGGFRPGKLDGEGWVEFCLPRLPFRSGAFHVNAAVQDSDASFLYDRRAREFWLQVSGEPDPQANGLLNLDGNWRTGP